MELRVTEVACARGGLPVLGGVSFTLRAGDAAVLRGPNGIGKTTLLRTLAGLQPALAGEVSAPTEAMAYAGHADALKPTLTAAETLRFWARVFGTGDISPALAAFDLERLADRPARHLSAGQRRRLGLARLLVMGRPVWLLDEPTVALDDASLGRFARTVCDHLAAGGSVLAATHASLDIAARPLDVAAWRARRPEPAGFDTAFA